MEIESIRPVLSGLVGGVSAVLFCYALSRWVPEICNGKSAATLIRENRPGIWLANAFFIGGLLSGIATYQLGLLPQTDWRGLALGAGGGSIAALVALGLAALMAGRSPKEAYVAYAISQKTPASILYGILSLCVISFVVAVASLFG